MGEKASKANPSFNYFQEAAKKNHTVFENLIVCVGGLAEDPTT